MLREEKIFKNS